MIIIEESTKEQPSPDRVEAQFHSTPYSQESSLAQDNPPSYSYYGSTSDSARHDAPSVQIHASGEDVVYRYGQSPARRFVKTFLVACLAWVLVTILVQSSIIMIYGYREDKRGGSKLDGQWSYDVPPGLLLSDCVQGGGWSERSHSEFARNATTSQKKHPPPRRDHDSPPPQSSETTFTVPLSEVDLLLVSRGQLSRGVVTVVTSPSQAQDTATFRIKVEYHDEDLRDLAKVCLIGQKDDQRAKGLGIFTPTWASGHHDGNRDNIDFETTLILPESYPPNPALFINSLEIDTSETVRRFEDLNAATHFRSLVLKGRNSPVEIQTLQATNVHIQTTNAHVSGNLNISDSLAITTTNGPIVVNVELSNYGSPPSFTARTTNGVIDARISLTVPPAYKPENASYVISARTTDALTIDISAQPINSNLFLNGTTTNGPAFVRLSPSYEGAFSLRSSEDIFIRRSDTEDPSGMQRRRNLGYRTRADGQQVTEGTTQWECQKGEEAGLHGVGMVQISSKNAPLTLDV